MTFDGLVMAIARGNVVAESATAFVYGVVIEDQRMVCGGVASREHAAAAFCKATTALPDNSEGAGQQMRGRTIFTEKRLARDLE